MGAFKISGQLITAGGAERGTLSIDHTAGLAPHALRLVCRWLSLHRLCVGLPVLLHGWLCILLIGIGLIGIYLLIRVLYVRGILASFILHNDTDYNTQ